MRKSILFVAVFCTCFLISSTASSQPRQQVIYYYRDSAERILLWVSAADSPSSTGLAPANSSRVTAAKKDGQWSLSPQSARTTAPWPDALKGLFEGADDPWNTLLNKIQSEVINTERIKPVKPSVELYILPLESNSVIVYFVKPTENEPAGYRFTRPEQGGTWTKEGNIPIGQYLNLKETDDQVRYILGNKQTGADWPARWNGFIESALNDDGYRTILYSDNEREPRLGFQVRLAPRDLISRVRHPIPQTTVTLVEPRSGPHFEITTLIPYVLLFLFISLPAPFLFAKTRLIRKIKKEPKPEDGFWRNLQFKLPVTWKPKEPEKPELREPELSVDLVAALDSIRQTIDAGQWANQTDREFYLGTIDWVAEVFKMIAAKERSATATIQLSEQDQKLIAIGEATINCFETLRSPFVNQECIVEVLPSDATAEDWVTRLPVTMKSLARVCANFESGKKRNEETIKGKDLELTELTDRINNSEKLNKEEIGNYSTKIVEMSQEITALRTSIHERDETIREHATFAKKLQQLKEAVKLGTYLYQGQRHYRAGRGETAPAAYLLLLMNYSLFQLCASIIENNDTLRQAMRLNLFTISNHLIEFLGEERAYGFTDVINLLGISNPEPSRTSITGDARHLDGDLFKSVLSYMRGSAALQLAPYYLAGEKAGTVYIAN